MFGFNTMRNFKNKIRLSKVALCLATVKSAFNLVLYLAARLCDRIHNHILLPASD